MVDNKRIEWIDMARGILFFFVIVCHSRIAPLWLKYIYEPFFLTGFFFLSGYLYNQRNLKEKIKSIFNGLLIPFILYSFTWGLISLAQTKQITIALSSVVDNLCGGDTIWFIPCLLLVEILYVLLHAICRQKIFVLALVLSIVGFYITTSLEISRGIWCWETALLGLGFYALGGGIGKKFISKTVEGKRDITISLAWIFVYIVTSLTFGYLGLLDNIDMHLNHYEYRMAFICLAPIGCYSFIRFVRVLPRCSYLEEFGKYTLFLFPFHGLFLRNVLKVIDNLALVSDCLKLILSLTITIFICFILARYVYKYIPALGGKKKWWK